MQYILGYISFDEELTQFSSKYEADKEAEEWVSIEADSMEEAKALYEEKLLEWEKKSGLYNKLESYTSKQDNLE